MASPLPLLPDKFNAVLEGKVFTQRSADLNMVKALYRNIFATLCSKDSEMQVFSWSETELEDFLPVLELMPKLNILTLWYSSVSSLREDLKLAVERNFGGKANHRF